MAVTTDPPPARASTPVAPCEVVHAVRGSEQRQIDGLDDPVNVHVSYCGRAVAVSTRPEVFAVDAYGHCKECGVRLKREAARAEAPA